MPGSDDRDIRNQRTYLNFLVIMLPLEANSVSPDIKVNLVVLNLCKGIVKLCSNKEKWLNN